MAYYVYEYPDGYGYISHFKSNNPDFVLKETCSDIREAKEALKDMIRENFLNGKLKRSKA